MNLPNAYMLKTSLLLCVIAVCSIGKAQIEPQFKFYLAFEDAKNERDTVWFGLDENAMSASFDSVFGDTLVPFDSNAFQVSFGFADSVARKTIIDGTNANGWPKMIYALNFTLPIQVIWDTSIIHNNELPFSLKQASFANNFFWPMEFDLLSAESVTLDTFFIGGGVGNHFPLKLLISKVPINNIGIETNQSSILKFYPNPAFDIIRIDNPSNELMEIFWMDMNGQTILKLDLTQQVEVVRVNHLPRGFYNLKIVSHNQLYYEKIILLD